MGIPEFLKSRRVWGAISVGAFGVMMFLFPEKESLWQGIIQFVAMALGIALPIWSYNKP
jgi:hypothetical protein